MTVFFSFFFPFCFFVCLYFILFLTKEKEQYYYYYNYYLSTGIELGSSFAGDFWSMFAHGVFEKSMKTNADKLSSWLCLDQLKLVGKTFLLFSFSFPNKQNFRVGFCVGWHPQSGAFPKTSTACPCLGHRAGTYISLKNPFLQLVQTDSNLSFSTILVTLGMSHSKEIWFYFFPPIIHTYIGYHRG